MTTVTMSPNRTRIRRRTRALTVVAATGATGIVWTAAHPILGIDLTLHNGSEVTLAAVVLTTVLSGLAAWGSMALLERFRAARAWPWIAGVVVVLSLVGPLGSAGGAGAAALVAMHLAAGAVLIPLMVRSSERRAGGDHRRDVEAVET